MVEFAPTRRRRADGRDHDGSDRSAAAALPAAPEKLPTPSVPVRYPPVRRSALVVGSAHDPAEEEAEAVAVSVLARLRGLGPTPLPQAESGADIQRSAMASAAGGAVDEQTSSAIERLRGRGDGLPGTVRSEMENAFGVDFSAVRVHRSGQSAQLNAVVGARAFTTGEDIVLGGSAPELDTDPGRRLLAHELTHVLQNRGGEVALQRLRRSSAHVIRRLTDADGEVTAARVKSETSLVTLKGWSDVCEWEDEDIQKAIDERIAELTPTPAPTATVPTAGPTAPVLTLEERQAAALRAKVEKDGVLGNYDGGSAKTMRDTLDISYANIAKVFAECAKNNTSPGSLLGETSTAAGGGLEGRKASLYAYICGSGSLDHAKTVAAFWQEFVPAEVPGSLKVDTLVGLIRAGVFEIEKKVYRVTRGTGTNGAVYRFVIKNAAQAMGPFGAEWHVHFGVRNAAENPGFKHKTQGDASARRSTDNGENLKLKAAFGAKWGVG